MRRRIIPARNSLRLYCRVPASAPSRLAYIDWLRGLACVLMFQTHCYNAWLGGAVRDSKFAMWSQLGGTFPAPLFLFLAGTSVALITDRMLQKGAAASQIGKRIIFRGAQILGLGLLFRVQEYAISWGWAPWTDLFRVDVLNTIGVSIILMGLLCWAICARPLTARVTSAITASAAISALTPLLWTTWRPLFFPWQIESYVNGVHNLGTPQPWLFPIFPWTGFAFAGLALGFLLTSERVRDLGAWAFLLTGISGVALVYAAKFADSRNWGVYPLYDYWHTSPAFFATRVGLLLILVLVGYAWCRWGLGQIGFSPLIQLGKTSLLVYWVHIEFVYGRFHILPQHSQTILGASKGLLIILVSMLALSLARTTWTTYRRRQLEAHKPVQAAG